MADQRKTRKVSKLRKSVANKALMTSSASTRFRAEDNPEEEDIKGQYAGLNMEAIDAVIEDAQQNAGEIWSEEEKHRQRLLLMGVPEQYRAEALRRYFEDRQQKELKRRLRQEKNETAVRVGGASQELLTEESPYTEDTPAGSAGRTVRRALRGVINQRPEARYIPRGGSLTPALGTSRILGSLEDQITTLKERGQREGTRIESTEDLEEPITRQEYIELFGPDVGEFHSEEERQLAEHIFQKANRLRLREAALKERLQKRRGHSAPEPKRFGDKGDVLAPLVPTPERYQGEFKQALDEARAELAQDKEYKSIFGPSSVRGASLDEKLPVSKSRKPHIKTLGEEDLEASYKSVRSERLRLEQELKKISSLSVGKTPEETERTAREAVNRAFAPITDPLAPEASAFGTVRRSIQPSTPRITTRTGRPPTPIVPDATIEEFIQKTVESHHAPTHKAKVHAARQADRLQGQIAQLTEQEVQRREEEAQRQKIIGNLIPQKSLTAEGFVERSVAPSGAPHWRDVLERKRPKEGMRYIKADPTTGAPAQWVPIPPTYGIPTRDLRRVQVHEDPRLNDLSVEDMYEAYGHETPAQRLAWEKQKLKARLLDEPLPENAPQPFNSWRQQAKFMKKQSQARIRGFVEGSEVLGFDAKGKPIALPGTGSRTATGSSPRALLGVTPNIQYEYEIKNPKADTDEAFSRRQVLESQIRQRNDLVNSRLEKLAKEGLSSEDKASIKAELDPLIKAANEGVDRSREKLDQLVAPKTRRILPTDRRTQFREDEIVAPVRIIPQQTTRTRIFWGERQPITGKEPLPRNVDERRYIASPGAKGQTKTVKDPDGGMREQLVLIDTSGKEFSDIPRDEWEAARRERNRWELTPVRSRGTQPPRADTRQVPRKIEYKYIDPKNLELTGAARDIFSVRIPKVGPLDERVAHLQFSEDPTSLVNQLGISKLARVHGQGTRLDAARQIAQSKEKPDQELLERHGIRDKSEAKQLAEAALLAGFYTNRDRFTQGHLPNIANKIVKRLPSADTRTALYDVNEAFLSPAMERVSQIPYMIKHPVSSPVGHATGLEMSTYRYRTTGLIRQQTLARRALERETERLRRIQTTAEFVARHKTDRGPIGALTRWRMEPLTRARGYQLGQKDGFLSDIQETARRALSEDEYEYHTPKGSTGTVYFDTLDLIKGTKKNPLTRGEIRENARRVRENQRRVKTRGAAAKLQGSYDKLKDTLEGKPFEPVQRRPGFFNTAVHKAGTERNILIGGAVVGTAVGAAYLYHRHQQNKKPDEEKVAFYNRVLPHPFETPRVFPRARVTSTYKFGNEGVAKELGFAGKELPTQIGISLQKKRFAPRPMDRGYEPNLPLVGGLSLRGTPGGSRVKGLIYQGRYDVPGMRNASLKRTALRPSTHEVRILGKKIPGNINIGNLRKIELSGRNTSPSRMTQAQRENIIWGHQVSGSHEDIEHVKAFYRGVGGDSAQRLLEAWDSPDEVSKIMRQKGARTPEARRFQRRAVQQYQRVTTARRSRA